MRIHHLLSLGCLAVAVSCGGDSQPLAPSPLGPVAAPGANLAIAPADQHEEPAAPMPDPGVPAPTPDPAPAPTVPVPVTISIVSSFGTGAFMPNPLSAAVGGTVVWTNSDTTIHQIVLDDGTVLATVAPGESTAPITVTKATTTFSCAIHPSMRGSIQDPTAPPMPAPAPGPPDGGGAPPPDGGYDGYILTPGPTSLR